MMQAEPLTIKDVVQAAWRRRWLFAITFALLLLISAAAAKFQPKLYVANSLLLLQETGQDSLLRKEADRPGTMQERINGLRALLKSNHVLTTSVRQIFGDQTPRDPRQLAYLVRDLDEALSLDLIGTEFIAFRLKGNNPKGLGKKLEIVMLNLLETLMSDSKTTSAAQPLIDRRREELQSSEALYANLTKMLDVRIAAQGQRQQDIAKLKQQIAQNETETKTLSAERASVQRTLARDADSSASLGEQLNAANSEIKRLASLGQTSSAEYQAASERVEAIRKIDEVDAKFKSLQGIAETLRAGLKQAEADLEETATLKERVIAAEVDLRNAREQFEAYSKRYAALSSGRSLTVLNAPELMKMIDPPQDPEIPETSGMRVLIAGLLVSLLLPLSLVILSELFDPTLRRPSDFVAATGAPIIARLPHTDEA